MNSPRSLEEALEERGLSDVVAGPEELINLRRELTKVRESPAWELLSKYVAQQQRTMKDSILSMEASADGAYKFMEAKGFVHGLGMAHGIMEGLGDEVEELYQTFILEDDEQTEE